MSESLAVKSHKKYGVLFNENALKEPACGGLAGCHFIIDGKVAGLYKDELGKILSSGSVCLSRRTRKANLWTDSPIT